MSGSVAKGFGLVIGAFLGVCFIIFVLGFLAVVL